MKHDGMMAQWHTQCNTLSAEAWLARAERQNDILGLLIIGLSLSNGGILQGLYP